MNRNPRREWKGVPPAQQLRPQLELHSRWRSIGTGRGAPIPKRIVDLLLASTVLVFGFPVWCLIALAIRVEGPGSVLYGQERVGFGGRRFRMHKFRTMVPDAERDTGPVWAAAEDPRVTRVGAFLRGSHLDEVPQLLNVLQGEMSIVGPRPERPALVVRLREAISGYEVRSTVLPGITGLAQIRNGYDESIRTVQRKLRYDRHYIRRRGCLSLDLKIMAATFSVMFRGAMDGRAGASRPSRSLENPAGGAATGSF